MSDRELLSNIDKAISDTDVLKLEKQLNNIHDELYGEK
jgi:hypothetical protein